MRRHPASLSPPRQGAASWEATQLQRFGGDNPHILVSSSNMHAQVTSETNETGIQPHPLRLEKSCCMNDGSSRRKLCCRTDKPGRSCIGDGWDGLGVLVLLCVSRLIRTDSLSRTQNHILVIVSHSDLLRSASPLGATRLRRCILKAEETTSTRNGSRANCQGRAQNLYFTTFWAWAQILGLQLACSKTQISIRF